MTLENFQKTPLAEYWKAPWWKSSSLEMTAKKNHHINDLMSVCSFNQTFVLYYIICSLLCFFGGYVFQFRMYFGSWAAVQRTSQLSPWLRMISLGVPWAEEGGWIDN